MADGEAETPWPEQGARCRSSDRAWKRLMKVFGLVEEVLDSLCGCNMATCHAVWPSHHCSCLVFYTPERLGPRRS